MTRESPLPHDPLPLEVCSFESRRGAEMRALIERQGANATVVASMQELPLDENPAAMQFAELLLRGDAAAVVFMTGVGATTLRAAWEATGRFDLETLLERLRDCTVMVRGPKPAAVLSKWRVNIDVRAPEPNTSDELLQAIDAAALTWSGETVAVQEYGVPNDEFYQALRDRGATVLPVPVYRWALPDDVDPLRAAIHETITGRFDLLLVTSANQLTNILAIAEQAGVREEFIAAARRSFVGSIGPTASEALREQGITPGMEPSHPKMGTLVREAIAAVRSHRSG